MASPHDILQDPGPENPCLQPVKWRDRHDDMSRVWSGSPRIPGMGSLTIEVDLHMYSPCVQPGEQGHGQEWSCGAQLLATVPHERAESAAGGKAHASGQLWTFRCRQQVGRQHQPGLERFHDGVRVLGP